MEKLKTVHGATPIGTAVIVVLAMVSPVTMHRTVTRNKPQRINGQLVVSVNGMSGSVAAEFVYVLPPPVAT